MTNMVVIKLFQEDLKQIDFSWFFDILVRIVRYGYQCLANRVRCCDVQCCTFKFESILIPWGYSKLEFNMKLDSNLVFLCTAVGNLESFEIFHWFHQQIANDERRRKFFTLLHIKAAMPSLLASCSLKSTQWKSVGSLGWDGQQSQERLRDRPLRIFRL